MEEKGLQDDQRYVQLLAIRAKYTSLNVDQLKQLRAQIMVYRQLARNQPVDKNLMTIMHGNPNPDLTPHQQKDEEKPQAPPQDKPQPAGPGAPPGNQQMQKFGRTTHVPRPSGLDPFALLRRRENRIVTRIALHIEELTNMHTSMPEDLRVSAQIKLRALRMLNFQRQLRSEIVQCTRRDTTLETAVNVKAYKRAKQQALREARTTEKLERQQKLEAERKRRQKHHEFLASVLQHGKDFKEFHRENVAKLGRINKAIINYHANAEREQKKEQERIEKERMRRLMMEDEEGYRKLIDQKKDKRLAFLLSQTDEYICSLTEMVKMHKDEQQKKKDDEAARKDRLKRQILKSGEIKVDDHCIAADLKVTVVDTASGKQLKDNDAPTLRELYSFLKTHPGWEFVTSEDEESDDEEDGEGEAGIEGKEKKKVAKKDESDEQPRELIEKAKKVGDDEYKHDKTEEQTYYSIAHTVHEKVTEQASILVNGNLKEYQVKGLEWLVSLYNNNLNGILADEMVSNFTIII